MHLHDMGELTSIIKQYTNTFYLIPNFYYDFTVANYLKATNSSYFCQYQVTNECPHAAYHAEVPCDRLRTFTVAMNLLSKRQRKGFLEHTIRFWRFIRPSNCSYKAPIECCFAILSAATNFQYSRPWRCTQSG